MTFREKLHWEGFMANRLESVRDMQREIGAGTAKEGTYYFFLGATCRYAIESYINGNPHETKEAGKLVVQAVLDYFYGDWRERLPAPDGTMGHEGWKPFCLWYEEVMRSLPWACALGDWEAVRRIAEYPPENKFPEAARAAGETAWAWALVAFLRGKPRKEVERFLVKAETHKAKRPKLLAPVLRALLNDDAAEFNETLLTYLAYYRKSEFKRELEKLLTLDGTTLFHLGRKHGFNVQMPDDVADHVIRF